MANMLEMMIEKFKEFQTSQEFDKEFDKEVLIKAHEKTLKGMRQMESMRGLHRTGLTVRKPSEHWRPSVPLKGLHPIRARELQSDKHHKGRVLFGTLCVDAYRMRGIMTILEDQFGDAVRLAIYNNASKQSPSKLYPKGSKVAVKQPYFKQGAQDGVLMLRVDNPQDVEILVSLPAKPETSLAEDLLELRTEGNKYFRSEDWNKAIDFYSKCIDLALSRDKIEAQEVPSASNIQEKVKENLVCSYSNRAEAWIKLKQYGDAVQDCHKALALDQNHLKSLFRKGRAFHCLGEYKLACQCFDRALEQSPDATDIQLLYEKSIQLNHQNQQGEFDLSPYFTSPCSAPEFGNYIGPVLIKKSVGRGRGLFVTDDVDVGDVLLADNAIAFSGTETETFKGVTSGAIDMIEKLGLFKGDLEAQIISSAASSPRILEQLQYLADSDEMKVPPMDLFRINNASWDNYDYVCISNQGWELNQQRLAKIMLNVGCHAQLIEPNSCMSRQNLKYGLWTLPSFINHSCFHNANCIVVGEAMFVIAARKIEAGQEITIPYFPSPFTLLKREFMCRKMGFKCDCKRCLLERSLVSAESSPLQEIFALVDSIDVTALPDFERRKIAMRLEKSIDVLTSEEKQLIRASFSEVYRDICEIDPIHSYGRTTLPSLWEVLDDFEEVFPGNPKCFELFARLYFSTKDGLLYQKALKRSRAYMGKHDEGVLKAVLNSIATGVSMPGCTVLCIRVE